MTPDGWREATFGSFLTESRIPGSSGSVAKKITVRLYGRGPIEKDEARQGSESTRYYRRTAGQLIYSKLDFLNGAFALVPPRLAGRETTLDLPAFDISPSIDGRWLLSILVQPRFYESFAGAAKGSRKARRVNPPEFLSARALVPPLPEQRKIAAVLSSVDEAIEGTQALIDQLQVVKKAMMADLLTRGIPGRHKTFKQTKIGEVPEDWAITAVGSLGEFSGGNGFRPSDWSSAGLPIIRIQNLNGSQEFNYFAGKPDLDWLVEPGELLFAWAGSRGASFGPCMWPGPQGVLNQHIHRIKPLPSIRKRFFFYLLQIITQEVEKKAHGFKDTLVHLRKAELTNWPVALPPIGEQDLIVASLDSAEKRLRSEEAALGGLKELKSALMSVLLTGEVRVRVDSEATRD